MRVHDALRDAPCPAAAAARRTHSTRPGNQSTTSSAAHAREAERDAERATRSPRSSPKIEWNMPDAGRQRDQVGEEDPGDADDLLEELGRSDLDRPAAEARGVVERVAVEAGRARQEGADEAPDQERAEDVAEGKLDALAAQQHAPALHRGQDADELDAGCRAPGRSRRCAGRCCASVSAISRSATTRLPSSSFTGCASSSQKTRTVNHALSTFSARPRQGSRPEAAQQRSPRARRRGSRAGGHGRSGGAPVQAGPRTEVPRGQRGHRFGKRARPGPARGPVRLPAQVVRPAEQRAASALVFGLADLARARASSRSASARSVGSGSLGSGAVTAPPAAGSAGASSPSAPCGGSPCRPGRRARWSGSRKRSSRQCTATAWWPIGSSPRRQAPGRPSPRARPPARAARPPRPSAPASRARELEVQQVVAPT